MKQTEPDTSANPVGTPEVVDEPRRGAVSRLLLWLIGLYRMTAPVRTPRCRYLPTCSEYAVEAIETRGPAKGLWLSVKRLCRCHPFGSYGYDPVPEKNVPEMRVPEKNAPEKK